MCFPQIVRMSKFAREGGWIMLRKLLGKKFPFTGKRGRSGILAEYKRRYMEQLDGLTDEDLAQIEQESERERDVYAAYSYSQNGDVTMSFS